MNGSSEKGCAPTCSSPPSPSSPSSELVLDSAAWRLARLPLPAPEAPIPSASHRRRVRTSRGVRPVAPEADAAEEAEAPVTAAALNEELAPELEAPAAEEDVLGAFTRRNAENIEREAGAATSTPDAASNANECDCGRGRRADWSGTRAVRLTRGARSSGGTSRRPEVEESDARVRTAVD